MTTRNTAYGQASGLYPKRRGYPHTVHVASVPVRIAARSFRSLSSSSGGGVPMI